MANSFLTLKNITHTHLQTFSRSAVNTVKTLLRSLTISLVLSFSVKMQQKMKRQHSSSLTIHSSQIMQHIQSQSTSRQLMLTSTTSMLMKKATGTRSRMTSMMNQWAKSRKYTMLLTGSRLTLLTQQYSFLTMFFQRISLKQSLNLQTLT